MLDPCYIDDLLIISNGNFEDHLNKAKKVVKKLKASKMQTNRFSPEIT